MSSNYLKTFVIRRTLSHARSVQGRACSLPQIRVVGDQKSGKSSLLQCITGVHFPVKNGICMRAPTVVQCPRHSDSVLCEIRGKPGATFEEISFGEVSRRQSTRRRRHSMLISAQ